MDQFLTSARAASTAWWVQVRVQGGGVPGVYGGGGNG